MATPLGNLGWVAVGDEAVAYGTLAATPVYQHGISSTMGLRRVHIASQRLTMAPGTYQAGATYVDGEVVTALSVETDDMAVIYDVGATDSAGTYTFGDSEAVDNTSVSLFIDHGGVEYDYTGCKPTFYQWDLLPEGESTLTVGYIGQAVAKYGGAPRSPTMPPLSEIVMPTDLGQLEVNGNNLEYRRATIRFECPKTSTERALCGATAIMEPKPTGRYILTASIEVDLDDTTGNDTITVIDDFVTDGDQGTIAFGSDFSLASCYMTGDPPALTPGMQTFTINVNAVTLTVVTS